MKHLGTKKIETERLILRRFTLEDAECMYHNWAGDPEVTRFLMWPTHESVEVTRKLLEEWVSSYKNDDKYEWCIAKKDNDEPIGSIGAFNYNEKVEAIEIGYCISKAYWHQGITSEAVKAVMEYLLNEVGVTRIEATHDPRNPHSGGVMRKCGLKYEGTKVHAAWNNSGICDSAFYGYVKGVTDASAQQTTDQDIPAETAADTQTVHGQGTAGNPQGDTETTRASKNIISDETIEYVGILAKLELSDEEKEQAKKDMGEMLDYIDKLNELDTEGVEPMSHVFPVQNVFREDIVTNGDGSKETLSNAPEQKDGGFKVPRTIA